MVVKDKKRCRFRRYSTRKKKLFQELASEEASPSIKKDPGKERKNDKYFNPEGAAWSQSISTSHQEVLISLKQLAISRTSSLGEDSVAGIFTWRTLRAMDIILEEFITHRLATECPNLPPSQPLDIILKELIKHRLETECPDSPPPSQPADKELMLIKHRLATECPDLPPSQPDKKKSRKLKLK